jgi:TetR/AcrR family transcriptional repressor of mexCD-oprJ operon
MAAVAETLGPEAVMRTHRAAHHTVGALIERGQADGSFRTGLPARWLVTACIALVHACSDEVRAGHIDERDAVRILTASVRGLVTGAQPERGPPARGTEPPVTRAPAVWLRIRAG